MVLTEKYYRKYLADIFVDNEDGTYSMIGKWSPSVYRNSDLNEFNLAFGHSFNVFKRIYPKLKEFLLSDCQPNYRSRVINVNSDMEEIFLSSMNLKFELGVTIDNLRVLVVDSPDIDFIIQPNTYFSLSTRYFTIYIGKKWEGSDENFVSLFYDLIEDILDFELRKNFDVISNRYDYKYGYIKEVIVLPNCLNVYDANFIMNYYSCIFKAINYSTGIVSFNELYEKFAKPTISCLSNKIMEDIWNCADKELSEITILREDRIELCTRILKKLNITINN